MKKLIYGTLTLVLMCVITSCRNEYDPLDDGNYRLHREKEKPVMKTVRMSFGGDFISESEEPLLRAEDGDNYTAINVFRTKKGVADPTEEKYAYGLFKNRTSLNKAGVENEGISINVETGYTYRFEASILVEYDDKIWTSVSGSEQYSQPFRYYTDQDSPGGQSSYRPDSLNRFIETWKMKFNGELIEDRKRPYFCELTSGTAMVDTRGDFSPRYADLSYPRVKRFYGECDSFDPGLSDEVEINMKYKSFGLRIEVIDLPAGSVVVSDVSNDENENPKGAKERLVFPKNKTFSKGEVWDGLYSMNNLLADSETFNLQFKWIKSENVSEDYTIPITVKPGVRKVLKLNFKGTTNSGTKGNVSFSFDTLTMDDEEQQIDHDYDKPKS